MADKVRALPSIQVLNNTDYQWVITFAASQKQKGYFKNNIKEKTPDTTLALAIRPPIFLVQHKKKFYSKLRQTALILFRGVRKEI